jgi:hypothetical protein
MNIESVLSALSVLYSATKPTNQTRREANKWLEQYQKSVCLVKIATGLVNI